MDNAQDFEAMVSVILEQLIIPIEITPHLTCFGKSYYEWRVRTKGTCGIATSFPEAMREALNASLTSSKKRRSA